MAADARRAAAQKAVALPQADGVVREAPGPSIGPVRRIGRFLRTVLEQGLKVVVVVGACNVARRDDVAQRVALRADHAASARVETRRPDNGAVRRAGVAAAPVLLHVNAAG